MGELEEAWELALAEATRRARAGGRADIARYLDLRAKNDLLRRIAVDWLTTALTSLAGDANRHGAGIQIERQEPHRFRRGAATMVGIKLTLRNGVRALSVESGWPRTPRDGFVSGNGLACADIKHFGRHRSNAELLLAHSDAGAPQWFVLEETGRRSTFNETLAREHFAALLRES
jgi:hypothetical protein